MEMFSFCKEFSLVENISIVQLRVKPVQSEKAISKTIIAQHICKNRSLNILLEDISLNDKLEVLDKILKVIIHQKRLKVKKKKKKYSYF